MAPASPEIQIEVRRQLSQQGGRRNACAQNESELKTNFVLLPGCGIYTITNGGVSTDRPSATGKMLDDPRHILEVRQRLHLGMTIRYIADNPLAPPSRGPAVEPRLTQTVVQDNARRRCWALPYAPIVPDDTAPIHREPAPPPRTTRRVSDTVGFTDKHRAHVSALSSG